MSLLLRKRSYRLDVGMVRAARKVLGARTDSQAIQHALRKIVDDHEIRKALHRLLSKGRFRTVYR